MDSDSSAWLFSHPLAVILDEFKDATVLVAREAYESMTAAELPKLTNNGAQRVTPTVVSDP